METGVIFWQAVAWVSIFLLVLMIPTTVSAYRAAMDEAVPHIPAPKREEEPPARLPVAKLTRREYNRILRETEKYKRAARAERSPR